MVKKVMWYSFSICFHKEYCYSVRENDKTSNNTKVNFYLNLNSFCASRALSTLSNFIQYVRVIGIRR